MVTIREWMDDKTILITGGVGFFGKVLTEKLLRTCPGLKRIYLLIRPKGGKSPQERWDEIAKDELFEKLLAKDPDIIKRKITVLNGDMSLMNLGLTEETIEELKNSVNIIYHSAATVRFNDPLHKAVLANSRGTLELCKLATHMSNLEVFVHVSTSFCHYNNLKEDNFKEILYEPCQDWRTMLKVIEQEDPTIINTISHKIIQDHPNTYTFSKSLSEKIVADFSDKFPTVITRPPVVTGVFKDPIPGWTDNVNGVLGVTTGVCKGVIRVIKGKKECGLNCIAVDVAINGIIISSWEKATSENKELSIYNCAYRDFMFISFGELTDTGLDMNSKECTLDPAIWYPFLVFVETDFFFKFLYFFLHVLPTLFIDSILALTKKKFRLMKITIKIYLAMQALAPFTLRKLNFDTTKYQLLWEKVPPEDAPLFPVTPFNLDSRKIMEILHLGVKKYFLKEKIEDDAYHKIKLRRYYYLDRIVRGIVITGLITYSYKWIKTQFYTYMF